MGGGCVKCSPYAHLPVGCRRLCKRIEHERTFAVLRAGGVRWRRRQSAHLGGGCSRGRRIGGSRQEGVARGTHRLSSLSSPYRLSSYRFDSLRLHSSRLHSSRLQSSGLVGNGEAALGVWLACHCLVRHVRLRRVTPAAAARDRTFCELSVIVVLEAPGILLTVPRAGVDAEAVDRPLMIVLATPLPAVLAVRPQLAERLAGAGGANERAVAEGLVLTVAESRVGRPAVVTDAILAVTTRLLADVRRVTRRRHVRVLVGLVRHGSGPQ